MSLSCIDRLGSLFCGLPVRLFIEVSECYLGCNEGWCDQDGSMNKLVSRRLLLVEDKGPF
jgi:hypothetical protein